MKPSGRLSLPVGCRHLGAFDELRWLAEAAQIPVVTTLLGIGSFPESHPLSYGMLGMHGMAYANMAVTDADLIIAIGMRFDEGRRQGQCFRPPRAYHPHRYRPGGNWQERPCGRAIVGDAKNVLRRLNKQVTPTKHIDWVLQLDIWRRDHPQSKSGTLTACCPSTLSARFMR